MVFKFVQTSAAKTIKFFDYKIFLFSINLVDYYKISLLYNK